MKKLTLVTLIGAALSTGALACNERDKIESTFAELDNDSDGYISHEEVDNEAVGSYFTKIDNDSDKQLSRDEFHNFMLQNPSYFEEDIVKTAQSGSIGDVDIVPIGSSETAAKAPATTEAGEQDASGERQNSKAKQDKSKYLARAEFERMDIDRNGEISKAEAARAGVNEEFDDIDLNDDQLLSRVEYTKFHNGDH